MASWRRVGGEATPSAVGCSTRQREDGLVFSLPSIYFCLYLFHPHGAAEVKTCGGAYANSVSFTSRRDISEM